MYRYVTQDSSDMIYTKRVKTASRAASPLSSFENKTVRIADIEKVEGGFFSSSYVLFHIRVGEEAVQAKRRSSDFVWLREILSKEFPLSYIPPLTLMENKAADQDYTRAQQRDFELFLQEILYSEELMNSEILESFLFVPDQNQFADFKKKIDAEFVKRPDFKASVAKRTLEHYQKDCFDFEQFKTRAGHVERV